MTRHESEPMESAIKDHDVTLAFSVPQLLVVVAGAFVLVRALKGIRERQMTRTVERRGGLHRFISRRHR